jgi:hypothetical protein
MKFVCAVAVDADEAWWAKVSKAIRDFSTDASMTDFLSTQTVDPAKICQGNISASKSEGSERRWDQT